MNLFQKLLIRTLQAFFVSALLIMLGVALLRLIVPNPTQYVELQSCRQVTPWESRCITTRVKVVDFIKSQEDKGESSDGE